MNFLEQASSNGYPVSHSFITTQDGYILDVHRISGPHGELLPDSLDQVKIQKRKPLLFVHGLLGSSQQWLANGPGKAWGYLAADTGLYDSWFVNLRGNRYSRDHSSMEADIESKFWDFSFEEFGSEDIPAAI